MWPAGAPYAPPPASSHPRAEGPEAPSLPPEHYLSQWSSYSSETSPAPIPGSRIAVSETVARPVDDADLLHPCLRLRPKCQFEGRCKFATLPRNACVFHLKGRCHFGGECRDLHIGVDAPASSLTEAQRSEFSYLPIDPERVASNRMTHIRRILSRFVCQPHIQSITFTAFLNPKERKWIHDRASESNFYHQTVSIAPNFERLVLSKVPLRTVTEDQRPQIPVLPEEEDFGPAS